MKKILFVSLKILLLILFVHCADIFAAAHEPVVSVSVDKENAQIGDMIKFSVKAELPEDAYLAINKNIIFENFDTLHISAEHISEKPNTYLVTFDIAAYQTGILRLEPVGIAYIDASGGKRMFFTASAKVLINSILNVNPEDIKDIKPLRKLKIKALYVSGIILTAVIILILLMFIIKDIAGRAPHKEAAVVDIQIEALTRLDKLFESGIIKKGESRIFYYQTAEILRRYISKKYNFNAMEMTSTELLKKLENIVAITMTRKELKQFLSIFDLARYAGFKPLENDMLESLEKTKEFIRKL